MQTSRAHLGTLVDDFARLNKKIAIVERQGVRTRRTTYGELAQLSHRFAAELELRHIGKGDRVLLWGENGADWVACFFGCVLRGVLAVPIDVASDGAFVRRVAADVGPKLIVTDQPPFGETPIISLNEFAQRITSETAAANESLNANDALQIIFTSGTTSEPKGIVHTHGNVLASLGPIEREVKKYSRYKRIFDPIRILHTLPLSHVFGQFMGLWIPSVIAGETHYESRLVASELVSKICKERISVVACVPRLLDLLHQHLIALHPRLPAAVNASVGFSVPKRWWKFRAVHRQFGWKFWSFVCGGASLSVELEQFWSRLGYLVIQGYGMTETTALVSLNHPFRAARGTIGQVLPGREVKLTAEGELLVRGDTISNRIWQHGEMKTAPSEWLATGDLAEFDERGNLRFRSRKKDVIVTSAGLNIYPEDLEQALLKQTGVRAAAIVEQQTARGPEPLAILILNPETDAAQTVDAANQTLAEFQQIRSWTLWPELDFPRTSTGKVLKREITARMESGQLAARTNLSQTELDSLGKVELQARLEQQFGVAVDDAAIQNVQTEADIQKILTEHTTSAPRANHIYPHWPWNPLIGALRVVFTNVVLVPLTRFLAKPQITVNVQTWPGKPLLIVANHVSTYDLPLLLTALPRRVRNDVAVAMSGEMLLDYRRPAKYPVYLLLTALFNVFPLPRLAGFRRSFSHAGEAVDRGYSVVVFPEGRRSFGNTPQEFKPGAGLLWKELGIPALAMRLEGLDFKRRTWFRSGRIHVVVEGLLPIDTARTPEELTRQLQRAVFGSVAPQQFAHETSEQRHSKQSHRQDAAE